MVNWIETASRIKNTGFAVNGIDGPAWLELRHPADEFGQLAEEPIEMETGVKQDPVSAKGRSDVGETKLHVHALSRCQGVGQLVLMQVEQHGWAAATAQCAEIGHAHQAGGDDAVVDRQVGYGVDEVERRTTHAPFPEAGGQGNQIDVMAGMDGQSLGEIPVGASVKRFQKKKAFSFKA